MNDIVGLCGYEAYLLIEPAARDGLVKKTVEVEKNDIEDLFLSLAVLIVTENFTNFDNAQAQLEDAWQGEGTQIDDLVERTRVLALKIAIQKNIEVAVRELQRELHKSAAEYVAKEAARELEKKLMMRPLAMENAGHPLDDLAQAERKSRVPLYNMDNQGEYDDRSETEKKYSGRRAVFYVSNRGKNSVNVAVALNENGDCIDTVYLPELNNMQRKYEGPNFTIHCCSFAKNMFDQFKWRI